MGQDRGPRRHANKGPGQISRAEILQETKKGQQKVVNIQDLATRQNRQIAVSTPDPNLSRIPMGAPTSDITTSAKTPVTAQQFERVGWGDQDIIQLKNFAEGEIQGGYQSSVELGRQSINTPLRQRQIKIDNTGVSGEMRQLRRELASPPRDTNVLNKKAQQQQSTSSPYDQWIQTGNNPALEGSTRLSIQQDLSPVSTNDLSESLFAQASDLSWKEQDRYNRRQRRNKK